MPIAIRSVQLTNSLIICYFHIGNWYSRTSQTNYRPIYLITNVTWYETRMRTTSIIKSEIIVFIIIIIIIHMFIIPNFTFWQFFRFSELNLRVNSTKLYYNNKWEKCKRYICTKHVCKDLALFFLLRFFTSIRQIVSKAFFSHSWLSLSHRF